MNYSWLSHELLNDSCILLMFLKMNKRYIENKTGTDMLIHNVTKITTGISEGTSCWEQFRAPCQD